MVDAADRYAAAIARVQGSTAGKVARLARELGEPDDPRAMVKLEGGDGEDPFADAPTDDARFTQTYTGVVVDEDDLVIGLPSAALHAAFGSNEISGPYPLTDLYRWLQAHTGATGTLTVVAQFIPEEL